MTIFSKIIKGDIPCYKIAETENCFAFLDINPLVRGHVLCISKREVDYLFDLTDRELCDLQLFAKKIAIAQKKVFGCIKVGQAVLGLEVPHAHIHLIPIDSERDMSFSRPVFKMTAEEMQQLAQRIADKFE
jgi:histidine triad (HIT) family protein